MFASFFVAVLGAVRPCYIHRMFDKLKTLFGKRVASKPHHHYPSEFWPFDQPRHCATLTMRQVLDGSEPILLVSHDADDHGWQFIGRTDGNVKDGRVVCLGEMVTRDPSVLQVADLPPGWQATRRSSKHPWERRQRLPDDDTSDHDSTA